MTTNLHAHVNTRSVDCDGPLYTSYVESLNADEIGEHEASFVASGESVNDFHDIHFKQRVLGTTVSFHGIGSTIDVSPDGFDYAETTEEGSRVHSVRWCEDPECDPNERSRRDVYAEQMGY